MSHHTWFLYCQRMNKGFAYVPQTPYQPSSIPTPIDFLGRLKSRTDTGGGGVGAFLVEGVSCRILLLVEIGIQALCLSTI